MEHTKQHLKCTVKARIVLIELLLSKQCRNRDLPLLEFPALYELLPPPLLPLYELLPPPLPLLLPDELRTKHTCAKKGFG